MVKYSSVPAVGGLVSLIQQVASSYLAQTDKATPVDVALREIEALDTAALKHFFGELLSADGMVQLNGMTNKLTAQKAAQLYLKIYIMPYVYEQPGVIEAMRQRGHADQLPRPRATATTG